MGGGNGGMAAVINSARPSVSRTKQFWLADKLEDRHQKLCVWAAESQLEAVLEARLRGHTAFEVLRRKAFGGLSTHAGR